MKKTLLHNYLPCFIFAMGLCLLMGDTPDMYLFVASKIVGFWVIAVAFFVHHKTK